MLTTINILVLLALIIIDGLSIKRLNSQMSDVNKIAGKLETLNNMDVSRGRMVQSLQKDIESITYQLNDLRAKPTNQGNIREDRIQRIESSINNLSADLDRTIGTIDQVQEKIAEINVTLENIVNQLNYQKD